MMDALPTALTGFFCVLFSAALGSFANVLVYRLPVQIMHAGDEAMHGFNIAVPASHCPSCQTPLKWWHNLPLLSFFLLKGRCAFCHAWIPRRYIWIELGTVLLALGCLALLGVGAKAIVVFAVIYVLWVLSWIDALHRLLPDVLTLGLLWAGLLMRAWVAPMSVTDGVFGAVLGYVLLWLPYVLYLQWRGEIGLGLGDCKLLAAIGAWLGWLNLPYVLLLASVLGLVYGGVQFVRRRGEAKRLGAVQIPFGPFISMAAVVVTIWMRVDILAGWGVL